MLLLLPMYSTLYDDIHVSVGDVFCFAPPSVAGFVQRRSYCILTHRFLLMVMTTSTQIQYCCSIYAVLGRRSKSNDDEVRAQKVSRVTP